jgi:hypothetical protein
MNGWRRELRMQNGLRKKKERIPFESVVEKDQATVAMYVDVGRPTQHFNVV